MSVLITGNDLRVAKTLAKKLCAEDKVVVVTKDNQPQFSEKRITALKLPPDSTLFEKLFRNYQFKTVIFLTSRHLRNDPSNSGELDELNRVLKLAAQENAGQVICVSSTLVYPADDSEVNEETCPQPSNDTAMLLYMGEQLCSHYRKNLKLNATVLHVPYLYGEEGSDLLTHDFLRRCMQKETIRLPGGFNDKCDFLSENDLADFILRLINSPPSEPSECINLGRSSAMTFGMLANQLSGVFSGAKFEFCAKNGLFPTAVKVESARSHYGWAAMDCLTDDFSERINHYVCSIPQKKSAIRRFRIPAGLQGTLVKWIELIAGFLLMEALNRISQTYAQFQFVDFRLLYVVIMGCLHGLQTGIYAALLSCASYMAGYLRTGMNWETLFYNIDNWLPLVSYFMAGSVTGYSRDKHISREQFIKNQTQALEDRYSFLFKMHENAISDKEQLKQQLIGYRNSYGRLYEAVCRLESEHPEEVLQKAIPVLENMLDTKSIAIYTLDKGMNIAKLAASSESCGSRLQSTMKLFEYPHIRKSMAMKEIWCNKALHSDEPAYCAPLSKKGEVKAMIVIWNAVYQQMTASYFNLFKVLCGVVELSFARTFRLRSELLR